MQRKKYSIWASALPIIMALLLSACGSKISQENFGKIQDGMPEAEVIKILGEPTESSSMGVGGLSGSSATWTHDKTTITIQFLNGKVAMKNYTKS